MMKYKELLFSESLTADTKGSTIFKTIEKNFEDKQILLTNVIVCAIDTAPAMIGRHRGFIQHIKATRSGIMAIYCIICCQHLVAKHLDAELRKSLQVFIKVVNKIKTFALNNRLFHKLCQDKDKQFQLLLMHTKVRWLSKGNFFQVIVSFV